MKRSNIYFILVVVTVVLSSAISAIIKEISPMSELLSGSDISPAWYYGSIAILQAIAVRGYLIRSFKLGLTFVLLLLSSCLPYVSLVIYNNGKTILNADGITISTIFVICLLSFLICLALNFITDKNKNRTRKKPPNPKSQHTEDFSTGGSKGKRSL